MTDHKNQDYKLKYKRLGKTGLFVSEICLGAMTFGENSWKLPTIMEEKAIFDILDRFKAVGGNFLDTADCYGPFHSEEILGKWLSKQKRSDFVVATKVRVRTGTNINDCGLSRKHIFDAIEGSLQRLQTTYIDLYQCHAWDPETPLEETMSALNDLVRSGKVRYIGFSNFTPTQVARAQEIARRQGWEPFVCSQPQYHLLCRAPEWDLLPYIADQGMGVIPWSPLAGGMLSGKYHRGNKPDSGRVAWAESAGWEATSWSAHDNEKTWQLLDLMGNIAKELNATVAQVALRWLMQKPEVTAPIIGASKLSHLEDNLRAATIVLSDEHMKALNAASAVKAPYPYNRVGSTR